MRDRRFPITNIEVAVPSNRKFGFFFSVVFVVAFAYFCSKSAAIWYFLFAILALATFAMTLIAPDRLQPFNKLWFKLGMLLGKIVSPIVLGLIFFFLFTPMGVLMRFAGRDELRLKMTNCASHWKERSPVGPQPETFKNQF